MTTRIARAILIVLGMAIAASTATAAPATAHEARTVGSVHMAVGFGDEPAFSGFPNSAQVLLESSGRPVLDLGSSLKVQVRFGDQTVDLELEPDFEVGEFGTPGDYRAFFIPTRPGKYTFRFTGSIDGQKIDESFTSGPKTFSEVENATSQEFPVKDPTPGELAGLVDREIPRVNAAASDASDAANSAKTLGMVGIVVGALGLLAGGAALIASRRRSRTAALEEAPPP